MYYNIIYTTYYLISSPSKYINPLKDRLHLGASSSTSAKNGWNDLEKGHKKIDAKNGLKGETENAQSLLEDSTSSSMFLKPKLVFFETAPPFWKDPLQGPLTAAVQGPTHIPRWDRRGRSPREGWACLRPVIYPLVMTNVAIENGHRNSGFSH